MTFFLLTLSCGVTSQGSAFEDLIRELVNDLLGAKTYQTYYDSVKSSLNGTSAPNGGDLVKSLVGGIENSVAKHVKALQDLNAAILQDLQTPSTTVVNIQECCNNTAISLDPRFRTHVNASAYCHLGKMSSEINGFSRANALRALKTNQDKDPSIKFQWFGGRNGSLVVLPALNICSSTFDVRLRPYYYQTVSSSVKDIVILLDLSSSMGKTFGISAFTKLRVATDTIKAFLTTITPKDRINIIGFGSSLRQPNDSCYQSGLALGTNQNVAMLTSFLDQLSVDQGPQTYSPAFTKALQLLKVSYADQPFQMREKVILLLTHGEGMQTNSTETRCNIYTALQQGNSNLGRMASISSIVVDQTLANDKRDYLKALAEYNLTTTTNCALLNNQTKGKVGKVLQVVDSTQDSIVSQLDLFYLSFSDVSSNVTYSAPFFPFDLFALGSITAACLPVMNSSNLLGISCLGISNELLFNDIINFRLGQTSYVFAIDGQARTLVHPLHPQPSTYTMDPKFVDVRSVETHPDADTVRGGMISGQIGSLKGKARLYSNRGESAVQGSESSDKAATFYWHPIPSLNVSICLVLIDGERNTTRTFGGSYPAVTLSDQFDIYNLTGKCRQFLTVASTANTLTKLAPKAFQDPLNYSVVPSGPTRPEITLLEAYLEGKSPNAGNLTLKPGVRDAVALTYQLSSIWNGVNSSHYWQYVLYRYIGTREGVYRMFPSTPLPKEYDPTARPWYRSAVGAGHTGKIIAVLTLTLPGPCC